MNKFKKLSMILVFILCVGNISCSIEGEPGKNSCYTTLELPKSTAKVSIEQGLWGDIWFWKGDFMPGMASGVICGVQRTVYVYELTTYEDVDQIDYSPIYSNIYTNLITTVESDAEGFFQVSLEPGTYSIFIKEGPNYYANGGSLDGDIHYIFPVTITAGEVSEVRIDITTEAVF